jgi:hypothetical protein
LRIEAIADDLRPAWLPPMDSTAEG